MSELERIAAQVSSCTLCPLSRSRTSTVPGEGSSSPDIMFIGEAPGFHEDRQGRPFVGPAGKLLEELLRSIGLGRQDVYITNMVKCRPLNNRDPLPGEIETCRQYLDRQIEILKPRVIVTLGRYSLSKFFPKESISKVRGRPRKWDGITIFPMYHPAAALRQARLKDVLQEDFKRLPGLVKEGVQSQAPERAPDPQQLSMFGDADG